MKNKYVLIVLIFLFTSIYLDSSLSYGQSISAVELLPENPTNADEVKLIVHTSFELAGCRLDSVTPYYACGAFSFNAYYSSDFDPDTCHRSDTISLGVLNNGMYVISYRMYYFGWTQVDQADTMIVVGTTGLNEKDDRAKELSIWPNPSVGQVNILARSPEIDRIIIRRISGSVSQELRKEGISEIWQNTISLQAGSYVCTAYSEDLPVATARIIVTD